MSKKYIYIRAMIVFICLLFVVLIIFLLSSLQKTFNEAEIAVVETTIKDKEKIVFDLKKSPAEQRKSIIEHKNEYLDQIYDYIFNDKKFANCLGYDILSAYHIVDNFKTTDSLVYFFRQSIYDKLFNKLFNDKNDSNNVWLSNLPVTENYKEKHPKPLYEEFGFIKKEDYETNRKYDTNIETDTWLYLNYEYGIVVDEEEKMVYVGETKNVTFLYIDDEGEERSRVIFDSEGNEMIEDIGIKEFVFKYTVDDKGYVDDIEFVKEIELADDKYLDKLWENVKP